MSTEKPPEKKKNFFRALATSPRESGRMVKKLAVEFWNDHDFWVHTLAVKGGASAVAIAGMVAVSHVIGLPFLLAAGGIALCGAAVGLGVYVVVAGASEAWGKLREIYARARGLPAPLEKPDDQKNFAQRLKEKPLVQKIMQNKSVRKILESRAWKLSRKFAQKEQDMILGGFAVGGSFVNVALGVTLIATQLTVLPVIALGSLITIASVAAIGTLAAGFAGLYLTGRSIMHKLRVRAALKMAQRQEPYIGPMPDVTPSEVVEQDPLTQKFQEVQKPADVPAASIQGPQKPSQTPPKP